VRYRHQAGRDWGHARSPVLHARPSKGSLINRFQFGHVGVSVSPGLLIYRYFRHFAESFYLLLVTQTMLIVN
jgi:hypothetical protein